MRSEAPVKLNLQRPKGTHDILPEEAKKWQLVESTARTLLSRANYQEIRTPIFEYTDLFARGVGETTDIVNKEMYTFEKGERSLTLRPENTAGVVRAYVENGMSRLPKPVKLFYIGPMFRYERPQAGRQRQFHQFGLELFGLDTPAADAEAIALSLDFFKTLGLPGLKLEINNIGSPASREVFRERFRALLKPQFEKLCTSCQTRYETNPLRMLDCKEEACKALYAQGEVGAFLEEDHADPESKAHFDTLTDILSGLGIEYHRNKRLVRGLDYYTKTVFEITSTHLGAQNAVCGGGRYNDLVEMLGGPPTPAVGWAVGLERLVSLMNVLPESQPLYYVVTQDSLAALRLAELVRARGHVVEVDLSGKGFGKQLAQADKLQAEAALILGETEIQQGTLTVKYLKTGEQSTQPLESFLSSL